VKSLSRSAPWLLALLVLAGCASTSVSNRDAYSGAKLARPDRIIVYDFAATPDEVPADSALAAKAAGATTPQTAKDIEEGRKLGAEVAELRLRRFRPEDGGRRLPDDGRGSAQTRRRSGEFGR
jgi:hypothetical protein